MNDIRYRQIHLDFHTSEYIPEVGAEFDPEEFAEALQAACVDSITCFGRCHHGWLYYPSKRFSELVHPHLKNQNLLLEQIAGCHKRGIKVPIYTTAQWDGRVMREHPEWLALNEDGTYIDTQNVPEPHFYHTICLNSGYRDFFHEHLKDMIEVVGSEHVDGIFIDILFRVDCKCPACVEKMASQGLDPNERADRFHYSDLMLTEFKQETTALIRQAAPQAGVFYNSSHVGPAAKHSFQEYSHLELESLPSGGWGYDHFPATSRYARNLGKEMIGMTGKFHTYWGDFHSLKNQAALELECFQMLAMGAGCSIGDQLHPGGRLSKGAYELIGKVYRSVKDKEPYCRKAVSRTEIGVLNPEEFYPQDGGDLGISPSLIGTVRLLQELGYQFDVIDSEMSFENYRVLILPDCIYGNAALSERLKEYIEQGGKVIGSYDSCLEKEQSKNIYGVQYLGESKYERTFVMPNDNIGKDLPREEFVMYQRGYDIEAQAARVLMDTIEPYFERGPEKFCSHQHSPSSGNIGLPAVTEYNGAVYFSHPIFRLYRKNAARWCKMMVKDALELLLKDRLTSHDGPSTVMLTLNTQKEENRDVLHVLHYITEKRSEEIFTVEDIIPLYNLGLRIYTGDKRVKAVRSVPEQKDITFVQENQYLSFTLDEIRGHAMVAIQYI